MANYDIPLRALPIGLLEQSKEGEVWRNLLCPKPRKLRSQSDFLPFFSRYHAEKFSELFLISNLGRVWSVAKRQFLTATDLRTPKHPLPVFHLVYQKVKTTLSIPRLLSFNFDKKTADDYLLSLGLDSYTYEDPNNRSKRLDKYFKDEEHRKAVKSYCWYLFSKGNTPLNKINIFQFSTQNSF